MKVGFTLGEGAGMLLVNIARENIIYSFDPEKALKIIKESISCDTKTALDIILL